MRITHEDARKLIQFSLDDSMSPDKRTILSNHLATCNSCQAYAREVKEVESVLRAAMRKHWALNPLPLSLDAIRGQADRKRLKGMLLATRLAMLSMFFAMIVFGIWHFGTLNQQPATLPIAVLPNPTPSLQATNTKNNSQVCKEVIYETQPGDTLTGIAIQFAVDEATIFAANDLDTETIRPGVKLVIPLCDSTPTITARPPTFFTTLTPLTELTAYTPGQ